MSVFSQGKRYCTLLPTSQLHEIRSNIHRGHRDEWESTSHPSEAVIFGEARNLRSSPSHNPYFICAKASYSSRETCKNDPCRIPSGNEIFALASVQPIKSVLNNAP